mmetsp:Transcript_83573/g.132341  ORF Transcript_83573/g.132341 Transcript_83573/m.132341 type:complete len:468 (+) Transcript_83573:65-1468(+)
MRKASDVAELKDSPTDEHQAESCVERFRPFSLRTHFESAHWVGKNQPRPDEDLSIASPANKKLSTLSARSRPSSPRFQPPGRAHELNLLPHPDEQDDGQQVAKFCKRSLQLKAELQSCETEAAALRQRLSHLGDRSKEKRRAQWERRALHKDWASGAQTWTIWKAFAERSFQEAQKIRRIIGKVPADALTNGGEQLEEVKAALERAKSELEEEQVERAKLARALKLCEAEAKKQRQRQHFEAESMWAEIAQMERSEARIRSEEAAERKAEKKLRQEVEEERRKLEACPSKLPNERLQRADEAVDIVCMKMSQLENSQAARQEKMEKEHKKKVEALRRECEEMKREIGARKVQQLVPAGGPEAKAHKASLPKRQQNDNGQEETSVSKGLAKTQRLAAVQRIQRNVRGWQRRKRAQAKVRAPKSVHDPIFEQQSIEDISPEAVDVPSPRSLHSPISSESMARSIPSDPE